MRVGSSVSIKSLKKVKPVHVALLVASALYLIAGTAGATWPEPSESELADVP